MNDVPGSLSARSRSDLEEMLCCCREWADVSDDADPFGRWGVAIAEELDRRRRAAEARARRQRRGGRRER